MRPLIKLPANVRKRYDRRNARRRKTHLANGDKRAACGAIGPNLPLIELDLVNADTITCETCRTMAAKAAL